MVRRDSCSSAHRRNLIPAADSGYPSRRRPENCLPEVQTVVQGNASLLRYDVVGNVLLVGAGDRKYREHLLETVSGQGIWLLTATEPTWELPYISGYTVHPRLNAAKVSTKIGPVMSVVRKLSEVEPIDGVWTFEEMLAPLTAALAEDLDRPTFGSSAVENCRDKLRSRRLLAAAGLPQPRSEFAATEDEALRLAAEMGYPLILKPRGMAGSIGVVRVDDERDLRAMFAVTRHAAAGGALRHAGGALVETLVEGDEVSVDCAVVDGVAEPLFVARKHFGPAPFFEETGQSVDADDPLLGDVDVARTLRRAHLALGVQDGVTHTELKLTPRGPVIIEVNSRLGGDFVPHTAAAATGIDVAVIATQVSRGVEPNTSPGRRRVARNTVVYPSASGVIAEVRVPAADENAARGLVASGALLATGDAVSLPPEGFMVRAAYLLTAGDSVAECDSFMDEALAETSVEMSPTD